MQFTSHFPRSAETGHYPNRQQSRNAIFLNENSTPALWNACDYVIQVNFVKTHNPGAQNTAADYLSHQELDPKDKLAMKIREDVQTLPIEINDQARSVTGRPNVLYKRR